MWSLTEIKLVRTCTCIKFENIEKVSAALSCHRAKEISLSQQNLNELPT